MFRLRWMLVTFEHILHLSEQQGKKIKNILMLRWAHIMSCRGAPDTTFSTMSPRVSNKSNHFIRLTSSLYVSLFQHNPNNVQSSPSFYTTTLLQVSHSIFFTANTHGDDRGKKTLDIVGGTSWLSRRREVKVFALPLKHFQTHNIKYPFLFTGLRLS